MTTNRTASRLDQPTFRPSRIPSDDVCHRARTERDPAFDGRFFFAVTTTGIYCRPVCKARRARAKNVRYFESAAAAAAEGFRPCLRCRPEQAPEAPVEDRDLVDEALEEIQLGALDEGSVAELADGLGVGERRLRRAFVRALGASPVQVATHRRLLHARQMLENSSTRVIDVAFASGFNSLRRFNEAFKEAFGEPPTQFRRVIESSDGAGAVGADLTLRLGVRRPFDAAGLFQFLRVRAIPGVERVRISEGHGEYERTFRFDETSGLLSVSWAGTHLRRTTHGATLDGDAALKVAIRFTERPTRLPNLLPLVERVKQIFDLAFDPQWISQFHNDELLSEAYQQAPGVRVPGCFDPFELAMRAVLGQQVTVAGATTLAGRLAARWGVASNRGVEQERDTAQEQCGPESLGSRHRSQNVDVDVDVKPSVLFPQASVLVDAPLEEIGIPRSRAATLRALAVATCEQEDLFSAGQSLGEFQQRLTELPGIGPWTAQYVAMRALHARDAFLSGDLVLRKVVAEIHDFAASAQKQLPTQKQMEALSERWQPYRAYAGMLLWRLSN